MSKPEGISTKTGKNLSTWVSIISLILLAAFILFAIQFNWRLKPEPAVIGCTSNQWITPDGELEVFTDQQVSPDKEWICVATSPEGPFNWERYQVEESEITTIDCSTCSDCLACSENPCANRTTPVLYEGEFPGTVKGPAIIEWWDGGPATPEHEGIFKLDVGEEDFEYQYFGHFWVFCSQEALEIRYPDHMEEFFAKWPMDKEGRPPTQ